MRIDPATLSPGEALLWRHGITAPEHIDLDELAASEGAEVRYRELDGCEARLVVYGGRGIISVRKDQRNAGRQRFSLAHELAHWMRDRKAGGLMCAADDISPSNVEARSREAEANAYASQLILPDYLVVPRAGDLPLTLEGAQKLAQMFASSLTAAALKLIRHTVRPAGIVCHKPNGKFWFSRGRGLPSDAFILPELHHESPAFALLYGNDGGRTQPHKEPASRWLSGASIRGKEVVCQSMKVPDGSVLTILSYA